MDPQGFMIQFFPLQIVPLIERETVLLLQEQYVTYFI